MRLNSPESLKTGDELQGGSYSQVLNRIQEANRKLESNPFDIEAKQTHSYCEAVLRETGGAPQELRAITCESPIPQMVFTNTLPRCDST